MRCRFTISVLLFIVVTVFIFSCQKELSCEGPACRGEYDDGKAVYSFVQNNGQCANAIVSGSYFKGVALDTSNYITVQVDVSKKGAFNISTDTINGFYFNAQGSFADTTAQAVILKETRKAT